LDFNKIATNMIPNPFLQFNILTIHFFRRLFQNDMVSFKEQMQERVIGILSIIATFSGIVAYIILAKYLLIPDTGNSWIERCVFITFCMLIMSFVAILEWDLMVPDERDHANLSPLPIKTSTIFLSKFASLCLFVGLFAISINAISTLSFIFILPQAKSLGLLSILKYGIAHITTMFLVCLFSFLSNVFFIGILINFVGYKIFRRISLYIRTFFIIVYVLLFLAFLRLLLYGWENLFFLEKFITNQTSIRTIGKYFPPLWFTDLYESLLGNTKIPFHGSSKYVLISIGILIIGFFISTGIQYKSFLKKIDSSKTKNRFLKKVQSILTGAFDTIFLRNSIQCSIYYFYKKTLKSSMYHKMRVASFVALGIGIIPFQLAFNEILPKTLTGINKTMLSIPLIIYSFLLLGLRGVINIPINLEANWIFQLTEGKNTRHYFLGLKKAILFNNIIPLFIFFYIFYSILWDHITAFNHCIFGLVLAVLIMEILLINYSKIPFACSYLPGKEKMQFLWLFYLIIFIIYINVITQVELILLKNPPNLFIYFLVIFIIILSIRFYQVFQIYNKNKIQYKEVVDPVMIGLDYKTPKHIR